MITIFVTSLQHSGFEFSSVRRAGEWLISLSELQDRIKEVDDDEDRCPDQVKSTLYDIYSFHEESLHYNEKFPLELTRAVRRLESYLIRLGHAVVGKSDVLAKSHRIDEVRVKRLRCEGFYAHPHGSNAKN